MNFNTTFLAWGCCLLLSSQLAAEDFGHLQVNKSGALSGDEVTMGASHFGEAYKSFFKQANAHVRPDAGFPKIENGVWLLKGNFSSFNIEERIKKLQDNEISVSVALNAATPIKAADLAWQIDLPLDKFAGKSLDFDGKKVLLPQDPTKGVVANIPYFNTLSIPCQNFKLSISAGSSALVQDDRVYGGSVYVIRIGFAPRSGEITSAKLSLNIKTASYDSKPLNLSSAFNFGFKDEIAGDNAGGWTDQGPENDLRMLESGLRTFGGVKFEIVDPAKNNGRTCLAFGGEHIKGLPKKASVDIPNVSMRNLCLLHALAWPSNNKSKVGSVNVVYSDGSANNFPVLNDVDVGNWWQPSMLDNAQVVWTGENKLSYVGLYMTLFPLAQKPVTKIEFVHESSSEWMIVAASAASDDIPKVSSVPFYITESADWKPIEFPRQVDMGSALDFSTLGLLDAPAGKHGFVVASNGHFAFADAPKKPVRFYGTNICFGICAPEKKDAELLASMIASCGYNAVRLHHFDSFLTDSHDSDGTRLNPDALDKLHYLFKCLKDRGIYTTLDLYTIRKIKIGERAVDGCDAKTFMLLDEMVQDRLLCFSKNLLSQVNPYTGLALKDDPALTTISFINEGSLLGDSFVAGLSPECKALYDKTFELWLKENGKQAANAADKIFLETSFKIAVHDKAFARISHTLRAMGVKALFTDQNFLDLATLTPSRSKYDYVDNHAYWAHPHLLGGGWRPPVSADERSAITAMGLVPALLFPTRIFDKPFTVSEFNFCAPNQFRAEGGALTGAYASLQGWDAVYRFDYAVEAKQLHGDGITEFFDGVNDPMQLMSDRLGALLFLRSDVATSTLMIPITVSSLTKLGSNGKYYSELMRNAGLVGQVGSVVTNDSNAVFCVGADENEHAALAKLKAVYSFGKGSLDLDRKCAKSSTGELAIDGTKGSFIVSTPRTESIVSVQSAKLSSGVMTADIQRGFASVSVSSLDGAPIACSKRMIVLHLTNALNSKMKFRDKSMRVLENFGTSPLLVRRGTAHLTLKLTSGDTPKVYGIDLAGRRLGEVKSSFSEDGYLSFIADTFAFKTPCLAYELVR